MIPVLLRQLVARRGPPAAIAMALRTGAAVTDGATADAALEQLCDRASVGVLERFGPAFTRADGPGSDGPRMRLAALLILRTRATPDLEPHDCEELATLIRNHRERDTISAEDAADRMLAIPNSADGILRALALGKPDDWCRRVVVRAGPQATPDGYVSACLDCPQIGDEALLIGAYQRGTKREAALDALLPISTSASCALAELSRHSVDPAVAAAGRRLFDRVGPPATPILEADRRAFDADDLARTGMWLIRGDAERAVHVLRRIADVSGWSSRRELPPMPPDPQSTLNAVVALDTPRFERMWAATCILAWAADSWPDPHAPIVTMAAALALRQDVDARLRDIALSTVFGMSFATNDEPGALAIADEWLPEPTTPQTLAAVAGLFDTMSKGLRGETLRSARIEAPSWAALWAERLRVHPELDAPSLIDRLVRIEGCEPVVLQAAATCARPEPFVTILSQIGSRRALGWLCDVDLPAARVAEQVIRQREPDAPTNSGAVSLAGPSGAVSIVGDP